MSVEDGQEQGAVIDSVLRKLFSMIELSEAIEVVMKTRCTSKE